MTRRHQRLFTDLDRDALLKAIGECRQACIKASIQAPPAAAIFWEIHDLTKAIDKLAGFLTGDPEHFHTEGHSI